MTPTPSTGSPRPPLEVQAAFGWRFAISGSIFAFIALPLLVSTVVHALEGVHGKELERLILLTGFISIATVLPLLLTWWARATSARRFDATGVTRFDGKHLPWADFRSVARVTQQSREGRMNETRIDLVFAGGTARIVSGTVQNLAEVIPVVHALERKQNPWTTDV